MAHVFIKMPKKRKYKLVEFGEVIPSETVRYQGEWVTKTGRLWAANANGDIVEIAEIEVVAKEPYAKKC